MNGSEVVVACCQVALNVGDRPGNLLRLKRAILAAADADANIVVLPELANTGYMFRDSVELADNVEAVDGPTVTSWVELAREHSLVIVGGFAERGSDGKFYNSAVIVDGTGILASYRKAHRWGMEQELYEAGHEVPPVVDTAFGRIGLMVCYDLEFPEWVRSVALAGAELLCSPVNWPFYPRPEGERPSEIVKVQADAGTNRMFIAAADRVGTERGQEWLGGSVIVDADGFPLTPITLGAEALLLATLDLSEARSKVIGDRNDVQRDRRPELYARVEGLTGE